MASPLVAFGTFLYEQFLETPRWTPSSPALLTGRTVIVTGANSGMGFEAAIKLAALDAKLIIMAVRNRAKGARAREELVGRAGVAAERVQLWELDLASLDSVRAFAARAHSELDRLDILCENAGVNFTGWKETDDKWEQTLQVNAIATGLLGVLLLPLLAKTAALPLEPGQKEFKPHLTICGSDGHAFAAPQPVAAGRSLLQDLNDPAGANAGGRYEFTKLVSLFLARKIAGLPQAKGVNVCCVNPGLTVSEFRRDAQGLAARLMDWAARTTETGARNIAWACEKETPPGAYVSVTSVRSSSIYSRSAAAKRLEDDLWAELVEEWVKLEPKVKQIVE